MYKINELKRKSLSLYKRAYWTFFKRKAQSIVFVAGMQRSGTNMLMDILDKSREADVYHERDNRAFDNYKMRELQVIKALITQSKEPVFIIKSLFELQDLGNFQHEFSPCKIIWIVRDYKDTVNSMNASFKNMENQLLRIIHHDTDEWFAQGVSDNTLEILNTVVYKGMGDVSASAVQWYLRNILFFEQNFHANKNVLLISYEKLVNNPQLEITKICKFINIAFHERMAAGIFSSSISKKTPPALDEKIMQLCEKLQERFIKSSKNDQ